MSKKVSTPSQINAKLGMHGVADVDVVTALTAAYNGVLNNSAYPTPPIDRVSFKAGIDKFSAVSVDAEDGGKRAISAKDRQRVAVIKMCSQLGHYVESVCNEDTATFITSGFTAAARNAKAAPVPLTEAAFNSIDRGRNSG